MSDNDLLEQLVLDPEFRSLESATSGFNIFEAFGAVRREIRHSDFLGFLLDPNEAHGLSSDFLRAFLIDATTLNKTISPLSPLDIDLLELSETDSAREWENIDILLISKRAKFACAIENKVDSGEHSNQLARYKSRLEIEYPDYQHLFIFLSPTGEGPIEDEDWLPYSYSDVHRVLSELIRASERNISEDVMMALEHYLELVGRHLMPENEITQLAQRIYARHRRALDIIYEAKPDQISELNQFILEKLNLLQNEKSIVIDHCSKAYIRFAPSSWEAIEHQLECEESGVTRILRFEFTINNGIDLKLVVGPGADQLRTRAFELSREQSFKSGSKSLYSKHTQIYKHTFIPKKHFEADIDHLRALINQEWQKVFYTRRV